LKTNVGCVGNHQSFKSVWKTVGNSRNNQWFSLGTLR
jgi:hypothetical protein